MFAGPGNSVKREVPRTTRECVGFRGWGSLKLPATRSNKFQIHLKVTQQELPPPLGSIRHRAGVTLRSKGGPALSTPPGRRGTGIVQAPDSQVTRRGTSQCRIGTGSRRWWPGSAGGGPGRSRCPCRPLWQPPPAAKPLLSVCRANLSSKEDLGRSRPGEALQGTEC